MTYALCGQASDLSDRLAALGGTLSLSSEIGRGTTVRGQVPLATAEPTLTGVLCSVRSMVLPGCQFEPLTLTLASQGAEFRSSCTVGAFGG